jgi:predicted enzyme related to lactoylglutathione lyase
VDTRLSEIGQIAIVVSDVEKVLPFYRDVLGLPYLFSPSPHQAFLSAGPVRIMLSVPEGAGVTGKNSILYFKVKDITAVYSNLTERGAAAERAPHFVAKMKDHDLWIAFVRDPDGNLVGLMEEKSAGV